VGIKPPDTQKNCARTIARERSGREAPVKKLRVSAALFAAVAFDAANAGPLPEAKPDDVGFLQQGLARLDDFFAREIAAKRVPGAVVAIARDGKLVHYQAYGQLDPARGTAMPLDAVFALASMTDIVYGAMVR
jgi:CubicO group peptidase (beta-lactamase class C family)